jgi:hypothetical protein
MSENDNFNYDNIDDMIELIYNFVYKERKNIEKDYVYEKLNIENIDMSRIIKQGEFDYNKILMNNFNDKNNFKLILEDKHKIILKKYLKSRFPITLIIQKYDNEYRNSSSFIDITYGLFINYILTEFVILNDIPFYLINMCNFNVLYETLKLNNELLPFINEQFKKNKTDDKYCISVYEHYRSYISMKEFLDNEKTFEELICLVFQVLYSYYYIINRLGNFRMNYFTVNSFIIEKLNKETEIILNIGDIKFKLRTMFICKICDFRYSTLETVKNLKNKNELLDNPSFDIYNFFKSLNNNSSKNKVNIKKIISDIISLDILNENIKNEDIFYKYYKLNILPNEILTKNILFNTFIIMPPKAKKGGIKNKNTKLKNNEPIEVLKDSSSEDITKSSSTSENDETQSSENIENSVESVETETENVDDSNSDETVESVESIEEVIEGGMTKKDKSELKNLQSKISNIKGKYNKKGTKETKGKKKSNRKMRYEELLDNSDSVDSLNDSISMSMSDKQSKPMINTMGDAFSSSFGIQKQPMPLLGNSQQMFQQPHIMPQQEMMMPQQEMMMPQQDMMMPQQDMMMPQQDMMMPQQEMMMPQQEMMMPQQDMVMPQQNMMMPQQDMINNMMSQQNMMLPNQQNMYGGRKMKMPVLNNDFFFYQK